MRREAGRKGSNFIAISLIPDVCNTPIGSMMVPVPYTVTARLDESIGVSNNVSFGGRRALTLDRSTAPRVRGDEAGTGRGVKTGGHMGKMEPVEASPSVHANGKRVVRHGDRCKMNDGNTIGKIYSTDAMRPQAAISGGKVIGNTNPPFRPPASGHKGTTGSQALHQAKGLVGGAKDAVVDMAKGLWSVAKGTGRLLDPDTAAAQAAEIRKTVSGIADNPKTLWEAMIRPYSEAISKGEYGNAVGRGLVDVGSLFIGGVGETGKAGEAANIVAKGSKGAKVAIETGAAVESAPATKVVKGGIAIARTKVAPKRAPHHRVDLSAKWYDENGELRWPPRDGFASQPGLEVLQPKQILDRYGRSDGSFMSPAGTAFESRALPYEKTKLPFKQYEVVRPVAVKSGKAAAWFDHEGGGIQYMTDRPIRQLVEEGYLKEIKN